jgi:hypothetical protein
MKMDPPFDGCRPTIALGTQFDPAASPVALRARLFSSCIVSL